MTEALTVTRMTPLNTHEELGVGGLEIYVQDHLHGRTFLVALVITSRGLTTQVSERNAKPKPNGHRRQASEGDTP
jgi:hypothetical protein